MPLFNSIELCSYLQPSQDWPSFHLDHNCSYRLPSLMWPVHFFLLFWVGETFSYGQTTFFLLYWGRGNLLPLSQCKREKRGLATSDYRLLPCFRKADSKIRPLMCSLFWMWNLNVYSCTILFMVKIKYSATGNKTSFVRLSHKWKKNSPQDPSKMVPYFIYLLLHDKRIVIVVPMKFIILA